MVGSELQRAHGIEATGRPPEPTLGLAEQTLSRTSLRRSQRTQMVSLLGVGPQGPPGQGEQGQPSGSPQETQQREPTEVR